MDISFELFIVIEIKIVFLWVMTLLICRWLSTSGGTCCLHPQGRRDNSLKDSTICIVNRVNNRPQCLLFYNVN
jgi:hypothetical protein